jgi:hypothetical protein
MAKKKAVTAEINNPALDNYEVNPDVPTAGIEHGIEYNLRTIKPDLIEAIIETGSKLFTKKETAGS